jgi:hypothetical protein
MPDGLTVEIRGQFPWDRQQPMRCPFLPKTSGAKPDVMKVHVPHLCTFTSQLTFILAADICLTSLTFLFYPPHSP